MKKIKAIFLNILHDKLLVFLLSLSLGLFIGTMTFNSNLFQASIIQIPQTSLNGSEVPALFPDIHNIKDIEITKTNDSSFLVEFFGTETSGDSLHPFSFLVTKEGNTLIGIKEIQDSQDAVIDEAIDIDVQAIQ